MKDVAGRWGACVVWLLLRQLCLSSTASWTAASGDAGVSAARPPATRHCGSGAVAAGPSLGRHHRRTATALVVLGPSRSPIPRTSTRASTRHLSKCYRSHTNPVDSHDEAARRRPWVLRGRPALRGRRRRTRQAPRRRNGGQLTTGRYTAKGLNLLFVCLFVYRENDLAS